MASAVFGGSVVPSVFGETLALGGTNLTITLTGDTWIPAGVAFDTAISNWVAANALLSDRTVGQEPNGWNAIFSPNYESNQVVRTSDTVLTWPFTDAAFDTNLSGYVITATETITSTIPGAMLTSEIGFAVTGNWIINPGGPVAAGATASGICAIGGHEDQLSASEYYVFGGGSVDAVITTAPAMLFGLTVSANFTGSAAIRDGTADTDQLIMSTTSNPTAGTTFGSLLGIKCTNGIFFDSAVSSGTGVVFYRLL